MIYDLIGLLRGDHHLSSSYKANEPLKAILEGLEVSDKDNILSIGIEQSLAMLEKGAKVTLVEYKSIPCSWMRRKAKFFKERTYDKIICHGEYNSSDIYLFASYLSDYFHNKGRLENISQNIENLQIINGNIFKQDFEGYNKFYFSNALTYMMSFPRHSRLKKIEPKIPFGSLVYVSDFGPLFWKKLESRWDIPKEEFRFKKLILDKTRTKEAIDLIKANKNKEYGWIGGIPAVFKKEEIGI